MRIKIMKEIKIKGFEDYELNARLFDVKQPKGIVQIIHGMQEHSKRYENFAKFLNSNGYIVFVTDLRGHGKSAEDPNLLGYSSKDISIENVNDQIIISKYLKEKYPNIPLIVLGHSYGSFLTQRYITECNIADKVILSGSAYTNTLLMKFGRIFANLTAFFKGRKAIAKMIESMSLQGYGKGFEDGNWLCKDNKVWEEYKKDEFCGTPFPASFYQSFFKLVVNNYKNLKNINKDTPLLIMSGDKDPVGENGKLVKKLYDTYKEAGLTDLYLKLYENGRHEMLNETNKEEVYNDILTFINEG